MKRKNSLLLFYAGVGALWLYGCARDYVTGKRTISLVSESQEVAMGRESDPQILAEYASRHDWITIVTRRDRGRRLVGPGVIDAFYAGYESINPDDFEFLCKLDLDLDLPPRYFEILMDRMSANPRIAAG